MAGDGFKLLPISPPSSPPPPPAAEPVTLRPFQVFGVEEALKAFDEGRTLVALNSPTGTGKSLLAAEIARRYDGRSFITSPQVSLVHQYANDPRFRAILPDSKVLVGRDNFTCLRDRLEKQGTPVPLITVGAATCYELSESGRVLKDPDGNDIACRYKRWTETDLPQCDYYRDKARAELARTVVTTLAYFLVGADRYDPEDPGPVPGWRGGKLSGRPLLIVDEAHGLENEVVRFLSSTWHDGSYRSTQYEYAWWEWMDTPEALELRQVPKDEPVPKEVVLAALQSMSERIGAVVPSLDGSLGLPADARDRRMADDIAYDLLKIGRVVEDVDAGIPWVVRLVPETVRGRPTSVLRLMPVNPAPYLHRFLWGRATHRIVMSGSFGSVRADLRDMGAGELPCREVYIPSEFPPSLSPVLPVGAARFVAKERQTALPIVLEALWRVLDLEPGRGVVHTQSFENVEQVGSFVPDRHRARLTLHRTSLGSRADLVSEFQNHAAPGEVLVSPSVTEGLDLPGDRGTFTVFLKAPFPSLGDERVVRRRAMADGPVWYTRQVLRTTIQGRGRVIRSKTDSGPCYLLDEAHCEIVRANLDLLPPYFVEAFHEGRRRLKFESRLAPLRGPWT